MFLVIEQIGPISWVFSRDVCADTSEEAIEVLGEWDKKRGITLPFQVNHE